MRPLSLKKDVLAPLTDGELESVVAGQETLLCWLLTNPCITPPPHTQQLTCALTGACS